MARRRATYAELREVPEHFVAEIVDGELVTSPRPNSPHARAASAIVTDLFGGFDNPSGAAGAPGGWWILVEPELHFADDVLVPDIAGWRREKMPVLRDVAAFTQTPDWLCEVVSPSTRTLDRERKMRIYARERVEYVWLVDPTPRTLEVYRLRATAWTPLSNHAGDVTVRAEPFDAAELDMSRWWLPRA